MTREEFIVFIKSIGFENYTGGMIYGYKEFIIDLYILYYDFWNGSELNAYSYNDLAPDLLKLSRSIKLKKILG